MPVFELLLSKHMETFLYITRHNIDDSSEPLSFSSLGLLERISKPSDFSEVGKPILRTEFKSHFGCYLRVLEICYLGHFYLIYFLIFLIFLQCLSLPVVLFLDMFKN